MHKYKVSFLPTSRSRKIRTVFIYADNDTSAISTARDNIASQHPAGELIGVQRPDRTFIDTEVD